ncbi:unnamed protein product [Brassica rapa subsp. trilocularis]
MSIRGGLVAFSPILAVLLFMLTVNHGEAIWLTIPPTGGTKCVSEEIQSNVVVLADYYVVYEHILKTHRLFLLRLVLRPEIETLLLKRKKSRQGVELQLRRLDGLVQSIRENINYIKDRKAEMREVSETTNSRVAWFSIMSLGVCLCVAGSQIWYLKRYFHKKKLI